MNAAKNILVVGYDTNAANPTKAPDGQAKGGFAFYDVSNPSQPAKLGEFVAPQDGIDVTDPTHMAVLSTIRIPEVDDAYDSSGCAGDGAFRSASPRAG